MALENPYEFEILSDEDLCCIISQRDSNSLACRNESKTKENRGIEDVAAQAFEVLYNRHVIRIQKLIKLWSSNNLASRDADYVANGAMMRMLIAIREKNYNPERPFLPYFHRIVRNVFLSHIKHESKHGASSQLENTLSGSEQLPLDQMIAAEMPLEIGEVFKHLKPNYQTILQLYYLDELGREEIEKKLNLAPGQLRGQLYRAKKSFRETYRELVYEKATTS